MDWLSLSSQAKILKHKIRDIEADLVRLTAEMQDKSAKLVDLRIRFEEVKDTP